MTPLCQKVRELILLWRCFVLLPNHAISFSCTWPHHTLCQERMNLKKSGSNDFEAVSNLDLRRWTVSNWLQVGSQIQVKTLRVLSGAKDSWLDRCHESIKGHIIGIKSKPFSTALMTWGKQTTVETASYWSNTARISLHILNSNRMTNSMAANPFRSECCFPSLGRQLNTDMHRNVNNVLWDNCSMDRNDICCTEALNIWSTYFCLTETKHQGGPLLTFLNKNTDEK